MYVSINFNYYYIIYLSIYLNTLKNALKAIIKEKKEAFLNRKWIYKTG